MFKQRCIRLRFTFCLFFLALYCFGFSAAHADEHFDTSLQNAIKHVSENPNKSLLELKSIGSGLSEQTPESRVKWLDILINAQLRLGRPDLAQENLAGYWDVVAKDLPNAEIKYVVLNPVIWGDFEAARSRLESLPDANLSAVDSPFWQARFKLYKAKLFIEVYAADLAIGQAISATEDFKKLAEPFWILEGMDALSLASIFLDAGDTSIQYIGEYLKEAQQQENTYHQQLATLYPVYLNYQLYEYDTAVEHLALFEQRYPEPIVFVDYSKHIFSLFVANELEQYEQAEKTALSVFSKYPDYARLSNKASVLIELITALTEQNKRVESERRLAELEVLQKKIPGDVYIGEALLDMRAHVAAVQGDYKTAWELHNELMDLELPDTQSENNARAEQQLEILQQKQTIAEQQVLQAQSELKDLRLAQAQNKQLWSWLMLTLMVVVILLLVFIVWLMRNKAVQLKTTANTDDLTQLGNRRFMFSKGHELSLDAKLFGKPLAAVLLDVDNFKYFNDKYGHAIGDQLLCFISECIKKVVREEDCFGRIGGEEFLVLLPKVDAEKALQLAERMRQNLANTELPAGLTLDQKVTASFGVVISKHEEGESFEQLLARADKAMYLVKNNGKNAVKFVP